MPDSGAIDDTDRQGHRRINLGAPQDLHRSASVSRGENFGLKYSPLSRKIVTFNLVALCLMMTGILYLNQFDESLINFRETALETDARLLSEAISMSTVPDSESTDLPDRTVATFYQLSEQTQTHIQLYNSDGALIAYSNVSGGVDDRGFEIDVEEDDAQGLTQMLKERFTRLFNRTEIRPPTLSQRIRYTEPSLRSALAGNLRRARMRDTNGNIILAVAVPLIHENSVFGAIVLSTDPGEIDSVIRKERGQILRIFFLAMMINVILSMALANTIAHPLQELAQAAEKGGATNARRFNPERIEIPDLTGRPDEIGYLAGAMKSMTEALYDRIDANETFAADVAHEIKNPLTSLRSAVDTMKYAKDDAGREKLLRIITMDVNRLDRLVTDISNASRLDSELVRDEMQTFDLIELLENLAEFNQVGAKKRGGRLQAELPKGPLKIRGLEGRLAQVFVNLITNAISFTEEGGVITIRAEALEDKKVRITVEDTGPGIPDDNLEDVFSRFYSERPGQEFGDHSGLGLAISKQIVDAHSGTIHAENVRPTGVGLDVRPDGARFVVVLPK